MRLLLITGVPGTGKTTISVHLAENHGFIHFDRELIQSWPTQLQDLWISSVSQFAEAVRNLNKDIVISWGFMPGTDDLAIRTLQQSGFKMIWLDGDRTVARKAFISRGTVPEHLLDIQMTRIKGMDIDLFKPIIINPFEGGTFLTKEEIAQKILEAI